MSRQTNIRNTQIRIRTKLLAAASAAALLILTDAGQAAKAAESDSEHPLVWIELGGDFLRIKDDQEYYQPPFTLVPSRPAYFAIVPTGLEKAPVASWDSQARITFQPTGSDWALSAGILFGRSGRQGKLRQFTTHPTSSNGQFVAYQSTSARSQQSHAIVDFQIGRDVGLGMFGSQSASHIDVGLRYAQFSAANTADIIYQPTNNAAYYDKFDGKSETHQRFAGIGPSLAWNGHAALAGNSADGEISIDWGANGAVLFGRQRLHGSHRTSEISHHPALNSVYASTFPLDRSKQIVVPNLGGFAGISWRYPNAKVSLGYRADYFFGAIDGGIDTRKNENRAFYGPYASISIGLGD